jgi:dephospho-CoA kinase
MLRVGLTGGIACGKTTVAAMLRELGCTVIDADALAHELIEPGGAAYAEVIREFGQGIADASERINRARLGEIVFADANKLARLNQILHPRVIAETERQLAELDRPGGPAVAVVEAALLIEAGAHKRFDRLVVAWCHPAQQRERLAERGMSAEAAERRIAAQMPIEQKRRLATDGIDCTGTLEWTRQQVEQLAGKLLKLAAA